MVKDLVPVPVAGENDMIEEKHETTMTEDELYQDRKRPEIPKEQSGKSPAISTAAAVAKACPTINRGFPAPARGHPPYAAIAEAVKRAQAEGMIALILEKGQEAAFHFILCNRDCVSFVRVRRLRYARYRPEDIEASCRKDLAMLRAIGVTDGIFRELWARGPDRSYHRYLVHKDKVEEIDGFPARRTQDIPGEGGQNP